MKLGIRRESIYIICVKDPVEDVIEGLEHLLNTHQPNALLYADIGGDALLLGYEDGLGSYVTDAVARAAIYEAANEKGVRAVLAVGALGAEGGGGYLNMEELVADLLYLDSAEALLGTYLPRQDSAWAAWALLRHAESGMLALYLRALAGRVGETSVDSAYLRGRRVFLLPHYKYVFLIDAVKQCAVSPLCSVARKGRYGLRHWLRPTPPSTYRRAMMRVRNFGWVKVLEEIVRSKLITGADTLRHLIVGERD